MVSKSFPSGPDVAFVGVKAESVIDPIVFKHKGWRERETHDETGTVEQEAEDEDELNDIVVPFGRWDPSMKITVHSVCKDFIVSDVFEVFEGISVNLTEILVD